jgi:hypothetical protein
VRRHIVKARARSERLRDGSELALAQELAQALERCEVENGHWQEKKLWDGRS